MNQTAMQLVNSFEAGFLDTMPTITQNRHAHPLTSPNFHTIQAGQQHAQHAQHAQNDKNNKKRDAGGRIKVDEDCL